MACGRCHSEAELGRRGWCLACEVAYDTWVRRHATDIIWPVLAGMVIISLGGLLVPLLGGGSLIATAGVFAGFGTLVGLQGRNQRRRRKQFLTSSLPRAYLR